jgi:hypothetical protein
MCTRSLSNTSEALRVFDFVSARSGWIRAGQSERMAARPCQPRSAPGGGSLEVHVHPMEIVLGPLAVLAVGRILLAWLPPGAPGAHAPRELAWTLGASYALGLAALVLEHQLLSAAELAVVPLWAIFAPWAVLLVARLATLPGALVPRHEPDAPPAGWPARAVWLAAVAGVLWFAAHAPDQRAQLLHALKLDQRALDAANWLALLALADFGLERARALPGQRALIALVLAALGAWRAFDQPSGVLSASALCCIACAAGTIAWLRRADRRGLWLAIVCASGVAALAPAGWIFALPALGALVFGSAEVARPRIAVAGLVAFALGTELGLSGGWPSAMTPLPMLEHALNAEIGMGVALAIVIAAMLIGRTTARARAALEPSSGIPRKREEHTLALCAGVVVVLHAGMVARDPDVARLDPVLPVACWLVLWGGLQMRRAAR